MPDGADADDHSMGYENLAVLIARLAGAGIASFVAIPLWSRTRDVAWLLASFAAIGFYIDSLLSVLVSIGVLPVGWGAVGGVPVGPLSVAALPFAFLSAAFVVAFVRKKHIG
jgi:hypothetical protein